MHPDEIVTPDGSEAHFTWRQILRAIEKADRKDILENLRVLDIGGGLGEFSKYLNNEEGVFCASIEKKDLEVNLGANQVRAEISQLPFEDDSFGLVNATAVFDDAMYEFSYPSIASEIYRVLKPEGLLVLNFNGPNNPFLLKEFENKFKPVSDLGPDLTLWQKI